MLAFFMDPIQKKLAFVAVAVLTVVMSGPCSLAQSAASQPSPSILDRFNELAGSKGAWTPEQLAVMARLRQAAMSDPYALNELRHLTDNIGPRLSGSPQAQQAVDYVAAEMRALGAEVKLEKAMVPHWVRGAETAELVSWPGQTPGTTQKVLLTALGASVATSADGLTAEVVVVDDWQQLRALPPGTVKGKILLFNHKFDKELAAQTANATGIISEQISSIQNRTGTAVLAIRGIAQTMNSVSASTEAIADAAEQQGACTSEISDNVRQASAGSDAVSRNVSGLSEAASFNMRSAGEVLNVAESVSANANNLRHVVESFLTDVAAA